jgi:hypothetical protein
VLFAISQKKKNIIRNRNHSLISQIKKQNRSSHTKRKKTIKKARKRDWKIQDERGKKDIFFCSVLSATDFQSKLTEIT